MKFPKKPKCYRCGGKVRFSSTRKNYRAAVVVYKCEECNAINRQSVTK